MTTILSVWLLCSLISALVLKRFEKKYPKDVKELIDNSDAKFLFGEHAKKALFFVAAILGPIYLIYVYFPIKYKKEINNHG